MDIKAIRRRNLNRLIQEFDGVAPLAEAAGTDPNYLSQLRGANAKRGIGHNLARSLERAAKRETGWLDHEHSEFDNNPDLGINSENVSHLKADVRRVPLISWVQAGQWSEAVDMYEPGYAEEWELTAERVGEGAFALRVEGDSMEPEFPAGSIIIVDPSVEARNGDFVVAKVAGAATFKQYVQDAGRAYLKPLNPRYQIIELTEGCQIAGVVVSQNKRYR